MKILTPEQMREVDRVTIEAGMSFNGIVTQAKLSDRMLNECLTSCTVVTGFPKRSSPTAFGCTSVLV
jgi:hypothetical protein